jgi:hypothetical protein
MFVLDQQSDRFQFGEKLMRFRQEWTSSVKFGCKGSRSWLFFPPHAWPARRNAVTRTGPPRAVPGLDAPGFHSGSGDVKSGLRSRRKPPPQCPFEKHELHQMNASAVKCTRYFLVSFLLPVLNESCYIVELTPSIPQVLPSARQGE